MTSKLARKKTGHGKRELSGSLLGLAMVLIGLWGLCFHRATIHERRAHALAEQGHVLEATREYASAIRYHVPGSKVTRRSAQSLASLDDGPLPAAPLPALQNLSASLEAISRPNPILSSIKEKADARLARQRGAAVPRPIEKAHGTWLPSLLFVGWVGSCMAYLLGRLPFWWWCTTASTAYVAWLITLRWG